LARKLRAFQSETDYAIFVDGTELLKLGALSYLKSARIEDWPADSMFCSIYSFSMR